MLQQYIDGEPQGVYKRGELLSDVPFSTLESCNEGNQNPDIPDPDSPSGQFLTVVSLFPMRNDVYVNAKYNDYRLSVSKDGYTWKDAIWENFAIKMYCWT